MSEENGLFNRVKRAWNAFQNRDPTGPSPQYNGPGFASRPDRHRLLYTTEKSFVASLYTRMALDAAETTIQHVRLDENGRYLETIPSGLNNCLTVEANVDQSGKAFLFDVYFSMFDEGHVAIVPINTIGNPFLSDSYDILSMRVGKIVEWYPEKVRIEMYNDRTGRKEQITLPKRMVGIVENPFYAVMNEPNGTIRRLLRKLNLMDVIDEQHSSGKLNMIIQVPYAVKGDLRKQQAELRTKELEDQMLKSKYGIAYTDTTEKITQLSRPLESNLMAEVEYLTTTAYSQLGTTKAVFEGTASNEELSNYYSRTIEPCVRIVADEMRRKFLTKTARTQHQSIYYFHDPLKFIPITNIADIADKFTRNAILSTNEMRGIIGLKASTDPAANELSNKNIAQPGGGSEMAMAPGASDDAPATTETESEPQFTMEEIEELEGNPEKYGLTEEDLALLQEEKQKLQNQNGSDQ